MAKYINLARAVGTLNDVEIGDISQFTVYTSAIFIDKTADRTVWADGELTYNVAISNVDDADPASPIEDAVFTDTLDPAIVELVANSVMNGTTQLTPATDPNAPALGEYGYNPETGLLTVPLGQLVKGTDVALSFRVEKAS